jgi:hypothetical protein
MFAVLSFQLITKIFRNGESGLLTWPPVSQDYVMADAIRLILLRSHIAKTLAGLSGPKNSAEKLTFRQQC